MHIIKVREDGGLCGNQTYLINLTINIKITFTFVLIRLSSMSAP